MLLRIITPRGSVIEIQEDPAQTIETTGEESAPRRSDPPPLAKCGLAKVLELPRRSAA